jgi:hypothetical protein
LEIVILVDAMNHNGNRRDLDALQTPEDVYYDVHVSDRNNANDREKY